MGLMNIDAQIQLDSTTGAYYPGQTVNGKVTYSFSKPKKVRGITVKFQGKAKTYWTERETRRRNSHDSYEDVHYTGKEEYFLITYYVLGSKDSESFEIPPGTHTYDIRATLPPSLPSSFEGEHGHIRYTITMTLDRPWKLDQETKKDFTVINLLDLNQNPAYKYPIHVQLEKTFGCFCCASEPLSVDVRAPVSGFVPGQRIPFQVFVENKSNVQVHRVKLEIIKFIKFRTTHPGNSEKKSEIKLVEVSQGPISEGQSRELQMPLDVPSLPPSNLVGCSLIDLDYKLKVKCEVSGCHENLSGEKYLTIGTVPLMDIANMASVQPYQAMGISNLPGVQPYQAMGISKLPGVQPYQAMGISNVPDVQPFPLQPSAPIDPDAESTPLKEPAHIGWSVQQTQLNAVNIQNDEHTNSAERQDLAQKYPTYNYKVCPEGKFKFEI